MKLDYNLESFPLEIQTNSTLGSQDQVRVYFYNSANKVAGGVNIYFSNSKLRLWYCNTNSHYQSLSNVPPAAEKIWRITVTRTPDIKVVVHCNGVVVRETWVKGGWCSYKVWHWYWPRTVAKIKFHSSDTASDRYRSYPGEQEVLFSFSKLSCK